MKILSQRTKMNLLKKLKLVLRIIGDILLFSFFAFWAAIVRHDVSEAKNVRHIDSIEGTVLNSKRSK